MRFHKGSFYIAQPNNKVKLVKGWISDDGIYGFSKIIYRSGRVFMWAATDIKSGLRICDSSTRKGCVEWIELNEDRIEKQREKEKYDTFVKTFQDNIANINN